MSRLPLALSAEPWPLAERTTPGEDGWRTPKITNPSPETWRRRARETGVRNFLTNHDLKKRVRKGEEQDERDVRGG